MLYYVISVVFSRVVYIYLPLPYNHNKSFPPILPFRVNQPYSSPSPELSNIDSSARSSFPSDPVTYSYCSQSPSSPSQSHSSGATASYASFLLSQSQPTAILVIHLSSISPLFSRSSRLSIFRCAPQLFECLFSVFCEFYWIFLPRPETLLRVIDSI